MKRTQWQLAAICLFASLVSGQEFHNGARGLPSGIVQAMAGDAEDYCGQWVGAYRKGCGNKFQQNLFWRRLTITPSGEEAILVENHNVGSCGSAGCSLSLFTKGTNEEFTQVLGTQGDVGSVMRIRVLKSITNGHYELQKTWADQRTGTVYKWNGVRYTPVS